MGLAIQLTEGKYRPVLVCDACEEPIIDWRKALAASELLAEDRRIRSVRVFHKGQCDPGRPPHRDEQARGWLLLDRYLAWLLWNSQWGKKFQETPQGRKLILDVPEPLNFA